MKSKLSNQLRLVAWEVTRRCNLACVHCRAASIDEAYPEELSQKEALRLIDDITLEARPILILTGGEPLLREDIFEIASYGTAKGCRVTMATNGTLITYQVAKKIKESGIQRVSVSFDGATSETHDSFRKVAGAFESAMKGLEILRDEHIDFQINTTITELNRGELEDIHKLAISLGAVAHHIFLLVPTGRGKGMAHQAISADKYEEILLWFCERRNKTSMQLKATCAPHYYRILRQEAMKKDEAVTFATYGLDAITRGCLGGTGFCFVSHRGDVQPCGYLEVKAGNVKELPFSEIWRHSEVFNKLRDIELYEGKCGRCEYVKVCGGCRARAYETTGNFMAEEPLCGYVPSTSNE